METIEDIQRRLRDSQYRNEEHVRLSLVARLLQEYGWDIWDPSEVNTEFVTAPKEDRKKVDVALLVPPSMSRVYIEVKPVGGILNLADTERQLRDYNRDITAPFCIITDGRQWRFYYSLAPGEFGNKCFKVLDLLKDDIQEIQRTFALFLGKDRVQTAEAKQHAEYLLSLNLEEKVLAECLPEARQVVLRPSYPTLPQALKDLASRRGIQVSLEKAATFIQKSGDGPPPPPPPPSDSGGPTPVYTGDLFHTSVVSASIGGQVASNWNDLVCTALRLAWERGYRDVNDLGNWSGANVRSGKHTDRGRRPVHGTNMSFQYVQSTRAWDIALKIARKLRVPVKVDFVWRDKQEAAHPGQRGTREWAP